jgi:hypothetical protein
VPIRDKVISVPYNVQVRNIVIVEYSADTNQRKIVDVKDLETSKAGSLTRVTTKSAANGATAVGAIAIGAVAVSAFAVGALAIGALAIGRLVIGRLVIKRVKIKSLEVEELTVKRLRVLETDGQSYDPSSIPW